jgi:hypothetical protein
MNSPRHRKCRSAGRSRVVPPFFAVTALMALGFSVASPATAETAAPTTEKAFSSTSWWNTPVPSNAPQHRNESGVLDYLRTAPDNGGGFLRLAGAGTNKWGQPVYWAKPGDREYNVRWASSQRPTEFDRLRIPANMKAADTSDAALTLFDVERGYVVAMTRAVYSAASDSWTVAGATLTYLSSNGLHVRTGESDNPRNRGSHRGNNGATMMARYDLVQAGEIGHVLKIAAGPECSTSAVFPMVGSDGDSATSPLKQGLRMRIRPDVNLAAMGLAPEALVIAKAIQKYGVYIGDSGGVTALKLENTRAEGRGQLWSIPTTALSDLPFSTRYWDVLPDGYDPAG